MATIRKRTGKKGDSYLIVSSQGRDASGRQVRMSLTWRPLPSMTAAQVKRLVKHVARFRPPVRAGIRRDATQTFAEYAEV